MQSWPHYELLAIFLQALLLLPALLYGLKGIEPPRGLPDFAAEHLNLNDPNWQEAQVFYAIDPGHEQRIALAQTLGRKRWVVVGYDPAAKREQLEQQP